MGDKGAKASPPSSRSYYSLIYINNIRDHPLYNKEELMVLSLQVFPFWDDLTLWDSLYRGMTGIKGVLFFCIYIEV